MGIKFSKQGQGKVENLSLQHHLMNYLSKKFYIRNLVSKQRRRMLVAGYDLDMSYITDHILAMSFPAERMRAMYRNPLWQVKSVLDMRHQGHYKIYNLCIEESYDPSHFHGRVESFPFDDNHVPPLQMIKLFCENVSSWISSHPKNIAVIHCMVSIPSQRRYVGYWAKCLSFPKGIYNGSPEVKLPIPCRRELQRIRLYDTVNTESIFFVVSESQEVPSQLYRPSMERTRSCCRQFKSGYESSNSPRYFLSFVEGENEENKSEVEPHFIVQMDTECSALYHKTCLDYNFEKPLPLTGDVRIIFYAKMFGGRLFYACFNSAFIKNSLIQLRLQDLDKVGKKGRSICGPSFCLELVFGPANAKHSFSTSSEDECPRYDSS
ncbi:phosphatidylinositol 3,4,5-trisphosphate 3-phosphatase and protein-tyrosine-phosphatase PTEN1-like isoform X2 [Cucurbita moschata]|uniref:Phosphatidylinositol 3,4,5-trisphosphate 3-phosphatase and protein-tyrosine-phosphatase PTEN1-like isoform X2 n=1 Tax=Cucurbita moschata TaxID=3662 RepID=A0A6J1F2J7_CUCMO|nr:phosphatidylinositol 3,4,5-trisphosphate 3-phosphatase and protein-tyrosine-phosphatase PTEN1-like isoform X2 [Cucurbita moschata]